MPSRKPGHRVSRKPGHRETGEASSLCPGKVDIVSAPACPGKVDISRSATPKGGPRWKH
jgi:hypothetical protein